MASPCALLPERRLDEREEAVSQPPRLPARIRLESVAPVELVPSTEDVDGEDESFTDQMWTSYAHGQFTICTMVGPPAAELSIGWSVFRTVRPRMRSTFHSPERLMVDAPRGDRTGLQDACPRRLINSAVVA